MKTLDIALKDLLRASLVTADMDTDMEMPMETVLL